MVIRTGSKTLNTNKLTQTDKGKHAGIKSTNRQFPVERSRGSKTLNTNKLPQTDKVAKLLTQTNYHKQTRTNMQESNQQTDSSLIHAGIKSTNRQFPVERSKQTRTNMQESNQQTDSSL